MKLLILAHGKVSRFAGHRRRPPWLALATAVILPSGSLQADIFDVTSNGDAGPGTLRQAILDSNATPGTEHNVIRFNLPSIGADPFRIVLLAPLPAITRQVKIAGDTQPGTPSDRPAIELDGSLAGAANGLHVETTGCELQRLAIWGFQQNGIFIFGGGFHQIFANFVGLRPSGVAAGNGYDGILISNSHFNQIGDRNVISANGISGIAIDDSSRTNRITGNYIGTDRLGVTAMGNHDHGILIQGHYNLIGGNYPGAGNLISGNGSGPFSSAGITIDGPFALRARGNQIQGNLIGTDTTGSFAIGNANGIRLETSRDTLIGGTSAGERNIVSGNVGHGILSAIYPFADLGAVDTLIQGNHIGTDTTGTSALANGGMGIYLLVENNANIVIGGTNSPAETNLIAFNAGTGVGVLGGDACAILGNSIHRNGGTNLLLGINLEFDGVTLNDVGDTDVGANRRQNFPVLTSAATDGGTITIAGTLGSEPWQEYRLEFFRNTECDPTGFGEGRYFLGHHPVTTDAAGNAGFTAVFPAIAAGSIITATATATGNDTSEFSACITLLERPTLAISPDSGGLKVTWPVSSGPVWVLQVSKSLATPDWNDLAVSPVKVGDNYEVTVGLTLDNRYFRLRAVGM
jgi:hypothetical protein